MKLRLILSVLMVCFLGSFSHAITVKIVRNLKANNGSGLYSDVNRVQSTQTAPDFAGVPRVQYVLISIECFGSGDNTCPQSLVVPGVRNDVEEELSEQAVKAIQVKLDEAIRRMEEGNACGEAGTLVTPKGEEIRYSIKWVINKDDGSVRMEATFTTHE